MKIKQYIAGTFCSQRKRKKDVAQKIQKFVSDYKDIDKMNYLRGIAYNLS